MRGGSTHLYIGTPAYSGWVQHNYLFTVLGLATSGIQCTIQVDPWAALLTVSRNSMISDFYDRKLWTHLLWLDADVAVDPGAVLRMVERKVDVLAAPVPLKGYFPEGPRFSIKNPRNAEGDLLEADAAATGCFLLSKKAAFALVEKAIAEGRTYKWYDRTMYDVFTVGPTPDGQYDTEDWSMCTQLRELGFPIYVDPTVQVSHFGMHEFKPKEQT